MFITRFLVYFTRLLYSMKHSLRLLLCLRFHLLLLVPLRRINKFCILGMLYFTAVLNLILLVCICFQVVLFFTLSVPTESVQRALRMVVFLTKSVVDVFGVLRDSFSQPLASKRLTNIQTSSHCFPKTLTLALLKTPIRTNECRIYFLNQPLTVLLLPSVRHAATVSQQNIAQ